MGICAGKAKKEGGDAAKYEDKAEKTAAAGRITSPWIGSLFRGKKFYMR